MSILNKEKIIEILQQTQNIRFAYLFGSRIKNKIRFGSDLDIAIYFDQEPQLLEIGSLVNELEETAGCRVDLVKLNKLYEINPKLAYSVIGEGIILLCNDEKLLIEYKKNVFLRYMDFKPVIDLFTKKLNERISNNNFAVIGK
jgi:predicted nucleotidyltransferase